MYLIGKVLIKIRCKTKFECTSKMALRTITFKINLKQDMECSFLEGLRGLHTVI